ncbi:MAG: glycosyltransferase family 39 protein [Polyangiaceae bacterium]|nr:glycosyltransferase family 39 protein [Polyangiaceae bacterium]
MIPLVALSVLVLFVRLYAAGQVGFGDSEALYASWAIYPQPAYLDHPGLIGLVARGIGDGSIPTPARAHFVTSCIATLVPFLVYAAARAASAGKRPAMLAALLFAVIPEITIGLFALTPDLLLAPLWIGAIALACIGLRETPNESRSASALVGSGLLAGVACSAKATGVLLVIGLAVAYASIARSKPTESNAARAARTVWPWAGLATGLVILTPIVLYETKLGFPMLRHRLVATQVGSGFSLRNLGGVVGGQLVYLSPLVVWVTVKAARDLVRGRHDDAITRLLFYVFAIPFVPLVLFSLWSRVAEPHWITPALLVLPIDAARRASQNSARAISKRMYFATTSVAGVFTILAHAWVLVPSAANFLDPKFNIANELYGWPAALKAVHSQMEVAATPFDPKGREVMVIGPDWTVCAQLQAGLPTVRVGCATPIGDDFDRWLPRNEWRRASYVLFVTDNRFGGDGSALLPDHVRLSQSSRVLFMRGGRLARTFELFLYENRASSRLDNQE